MRLLDAQEDGVLRTAFVESGPYAVGLREEPVEAKTPVDLGEEAPRPPSSNTVICTCALPTSGDGHHLYFTLSFPLYDVSADDRQFVLPEPFLYPGYDATASFGQVIVGTLYGLVDGAVGGAIVAWLYNRCAARQLSAG